HGRQSLHGPRWRGLRGHRRWRGRGYGRRHDDLRVARVPRLARGALRDRRRVQGPRDRNRLREDFGRVHDRRQPATLSRHRTMSRLVLFDIDGTILSSNGAAPRAFREALRQVYGTAGPMRGYSFAGRTDPQIARDLMRMEGLEDRVID